MMPTILPGKLMRGMADIAKIDFQEEDFLPFFRN